MSKYFYLRSKRKRKVNYSRRGLEQREVLGRSTKAPKYGLIW